MFSSSLNLAELITAVISVALPSPRTMLRSRTFEPFAHKKSWIRSCWESNPCIPWSEADDLPTTKLKSRDYRLVGSAIWPPEDGFESDSRRFFFCPFRARTLVAIWTVKMMCSYSRYALLIVRGEGRAPEITVTKWTRINESTRNIYFGS